MSVRQCRLCYITVQKRVGTERVSDSVDRLGFPSDWLKSAVHVKTFKSIILLEIFIWHFFSSPFDFHAVLNIFQIVLSKNVFRKITLPLMSASMVASLPSGT